MLTPVVFLTEESSSSRPGEIWVRVVTNKERIIP